MAKLYYTKDIGQVFDEKITDMVSKIVADKTISDEAATELIHGIRICQSFAQQIMDKLEEIDRKDDEEMAAWRAKKAAEEEAKNDADS